MIVEPLPLLAGRNETSGPGTGNRPPGRGDDAFDRTLGDALKADRRNDRGRQRPEPDEGRRPEDIDRHDNRPYDSGDRRTGRVGHDDPAGTNRTVTEREPAEDDAGEDPAAADGDRSIGTHGPRRTGGDAGTPDEPVDRQAAATAMAVIAESTAHLEEPTIDTTGEDGLTGQVTVAEPAVAETAVAETALAEAADAGASTDPGPAVKMDPVTVTTPSGPTGDRLVVEPDDDIGGDSIQRSTVGGDEDGSDRIHGAGTDPAVAAGEGAGTAEQINRQASSVDSAEPSDEVEETGTTAAGVAADGTTAAGVAADGTTAAGSAMTESNVSMAAGATTLRHPSSVPDAAANTSSTVTSTTEHVAPPGHQADAGEPRTGTDHATGDPSPAPDTVDPTGLPDAGSGIGDGAVEPSTGPHREGTASGLSPFAPSRAPVSSPTRPTTAPETTATPAPELVELQTTGLAERLRPAFAAVRRGVNGLDELRLRIQDDNAGPIKVDIATVDNRVRVLLSAGSDDLMRQLGQERARLADELRRAGFDQASVDIESNGPGKRHGYDDRGTTGRAGSGPADRVPSGEVAPGSMDRASARGHRSVSGLDLDL